MKNHNILLYIDDEIIIDWMIRADKVLELSYLVEPYAFDKEEAKNIFCENIKIIQKMFYINLKIM